MRDGEARKQIAELQADLKALDYHFIEFKKQVSEVEQALRVLGLERREWIPARWVKKEEEGR